MLSEKASSQERRAAERDRLLDSDTKEYSEKSAQPTSLPVDTSQSSTFGSCLDCGNCPGCAGCLHTLMSGMTGISAVALDTVDTGLGLVIPSRKHALELRRARGGKKKEVLPAEPVETTVDSQSVSEARPFTFCADAHDSDLLTHSCWCRY